MQILTYTNLYPNTAQPEHGIFVARRVEALQREGDHHVEVVAPIPYYPKFFPARGDWAALQSVPALEKRNGIRVHHPHYFNPPKIGMAKYGDWMAQGSQKTLTQMRANDFPFAVMDAHFVYPDGYAAVQLGKKFNCPVVVTARGSDIMRNNKLPHIVPLLRAVMSNATQLIAVSEELRENCIELGAASEKIHVIPNGIDPQAFYPLPQDEAKRLLGLHLDDRWMVSVARLDHNKGQWLILAALQKIGHEELQKRRIKLAFIGQGESRAELENISRAAGLDDIVHFAEQLHPEKICLWYNAAEIKILASSREGSPNVVLESLACGTPVVASSVGTNASIIQVGKTGFLFPPENAVALQSAILTALDQQWDRTVISSTIRQRNWATVAAEVESVLLLASKQKL